MQAHWTKAVVAENGSVTIGNLPFAAGESVEVLVFPERLPGPAENRYRLRANPIQFEDAIAPVAEAAWEGLP